MANFEIQKQKTITARIEKKSEIAKGTIEVIFTIEEGLFSFEPGQYVWVELLNLNFPDPRGTRRAFSIVSDPLVKNKLSIIFRISESGYKKTLISLPVGSDVHLIGPCGSFVLHDDIKIPTVFVAGGSGVASFFCIISNEILKKTGRELELFYFNDNEEKSPYLKELKDLERGSPFFKLHLFFGKLKSDDQTIVDLFLEAYSPIKDTNLYISGPVGMINIVDEIFSRIKIPSGSIHYEENYPSKHIGPENEKYFTRLEMFKQAVDQSSNHIIFTDENGVIKFANSSAERMTGYSVSEMLGQTARLWGGLMDQSFYKSLWETIKTNRQPFIGKIENRRKNGTYYFSLTRISPLIDHEGVLRGFIGTEEDITELENIDRTKTEFISLASHQLRTPITALNWYMEMIEGKEEGEKLSPKFKEYISEIHSINKHMIHLVDVLLDASRLDLGNVSIDPVSVDLIELARATILELRPEIEKKKIDIKERYKENLPIFVIDKKIAGTIFQNLLANAVKYTPSDKNGEIDVSIDSVKKDDIIALKKVSNDSILITVKDNGIGIPSYQSDKIFSRMFRADNARESENEGTGLGLYIVKKNIELISGDIWFVTEEGKGTTFFVLLPLSIPQVDKK